MGLEFLIILLIVLGVIVGLPAILTRSAWKFIIHHHVGQLLKEWVTIIQAEIKKMEGEMVQSHGRGFIEALEDHLGNLWQELKHSVYTRFKQHGMAATVPVQSAQPTDTEAAPLPVPTTSKELLDAREHRHNVAKEIGYGLLVVLIFEIAEFVWKRARKEWKEWRGRRVDEPEDNDKWWQKLLRRKAKPVEGRVISPSLPASTDILPAAAALPVLADDRPEASTEDEVPRPGFFERMNPVARWRKWKEKRWEEGTTAASIALAIAATVVLEPHVRKWFPDYPRLALGGLFIVNFGLVFLITKWRRARDKARAIKAAAEALREKHRRKLSGFWARRRRRRVARRIVAEAAARRAQAAAQETPNPRPTVEPATHGTAHHGDGHHGEESAWDRFWGKIGRWWDGFMPPAVKWTFAFLLFIIIMFGAGVISRQPQQVVVINMPESAIGNTKPTIRPFNIPPGARIQIPIHAPPTTGLAGKYHAQVAPTNLSDYGKLRVWADQMEQDDAPYFSLGSDVQLIQVQLKNGEPSFEIQITWFFVPDKKENKSQRRL